MNDRDILPSDRIKLEALQVVNRAVTGLSYSPCDKHSEYLGRPVHTVKDITVSEAVALAVFEMLGSGLVDKDSYDVLMDNVFSAQALCERKADVVVYEDAELVKSIMESSIETLTLADMKLPLSFAVINLPAVVSYAYSGRARGAEKDGGVMDIAAFGIKVFPYGCALQGDELAKYVQDYIHDLQAPGDAVIYLCLWGTASSSMRVIIPVLADQTVDEATAADPVMGKMLADCLKLLLFMATPTCCTEKRQRPKPKGSAPAVVKCRSREVSIIKYKQETVQYEGKAEPTGRKIMHRYHVKGYFWSTYKGEKLAQPRWCRDHWRGPELGEQVQHIYKVGGGER